jgi:magnesium-transporting ATPase (P-type)
MSLFEQFRRVANFYFLCISILMLIGTYTSYYDTPYAPWSTLAVLTLVVMISVVKGGLEDLKRHAADAQTNRRPVEKLLPAHNITSPGVLFKTLEWQDVRVGDIVRVANDGDIPADLVLLATSEDSGTAYIETSNIDGEANLKVKTAARAGAWADPSDLTSVALAIQCDPPNSAIHAFHGAMELQDKTVVPLDMSTFLLRGSSLRNTKWVLGVVVYTGTDTKLVMNSRAAPFKISSIERTMNNILLVVLAALVFISTVSLVFFILWTNTYYDYLDYLCYNYQTSTNAMFRNNCGVGSDYPEWGYFFTFFILYSNFLPISLYVTVEVCNFYQAYYIDNDVQLYDPVSDTPALARTSNMNADLGMVEYVFSDKTGTLTDNVMVFKKCSVGGVVYGVDADEMHVKDMSAAAAAAASAETKEPPPPHVHTTSITHLPPDAEFTLAMALCHTVIVEAESGGYQAESPDEKALVEAAADLGWRFVGRRPGVVVVERTATSARDEYTLLATVPFDSDRKRMSVVLRRPDGQVVVYCKGADNIIFDRATAFLGSNNSSGVAEQKEQMLQHLNAFGADGLRTLVFSRRVLTPAEVAAFQQAWSQAEAAVGDRYALMAAAAATIEVQLTVVGASAIEDKLQDGVPSTLVDLANAGIKLWVLTGDKVETAINIGYSAGLLAQEMVLIKLQDRGQDAAALRAQLEQLIGLFQKVAGDSGDIDRIWHNMQTNVNEIIFGGAKKGAGGSVRRRKKSTPAAAEADQEAAQSSDRDDAPLLDGHRAPAADTPASSSSSSSNSFLPNFLGSTADTAAAAAVQIDQLTSDHLAVVVDGETLLKIFGDATLEQLFLSLATISKCVLACRVSPEQKRLAVRLVKKGVPGRPVTLAIGDGANDVAMIQEADIGIGLSGKEGRQAVNTSDFAIARFRFLKRLLLVHGRLDYRRVCKVILFSFYKNIVLTIILFAFTFNSGYSGQSLFDDWVHSAYNVILAFPVVSMGVFDKDMSEEMLERYSLLYISGRTRSDLNVSVLLMEMAQAVLDAMIIFGIPYYCSIEPGDVWGKDAYTDGLWIFGTVVYTALVVSMFVRIAMITHTWTVWTHVFFWSSILAYVIFLLVYQSYIKFSYNLYGIAGEMANLPVVWWLIVLVPIGSGTMELGITLFKRELYPTIVDIVEEIDSGHGAFSDLLSFQKRKQRRWGKRDGASSSSGTGPSTAPSPPPPLEGELAVRTQDAEAALRYSRALAGTAKQMFPLDWTSLQGLLDSLAPQEQKTLGMERAGEGAAAPGSSFNFDHVASGSLHYITSALSAPLVFVSSTTRSSTAIGGVVGEQPTPQPATETTSNQEDDEKTAETK